MDSLPGWLPYAATPALGAATLLWWLSHRPRGPFPALANPSAAFFQDEYDAARRLFRSKASAAGAELHILPLEGECWGGQCGDPDAFKGEDRLTVDVAVVKGGGCRADGGGPLLLHVSGIHGVEGHAGSAVQCKWLDMVAAGEAKVPEGTTAVLVHVMNPYGYKHGRRYNENNVDLNRNLLVGLDGVPIEAGCGFDWGRDHHPAKPDYELFSPAFNYERRWYFPWDDVLFFLNAAYLLCRYEYTALKRAAVSGQYHNKHGIWFGGAELQPSYKALLSWLQREHSRADPVMFVDVHTGLGPPGVDTLLAEPVAETEALITTVFGPPNKPGGYIMGDIDDEVNAAATVLSRVCRSLGLCSGPPNAAAGYQDTKGFSANIVPALVQAGCPGWRRAHAVTQEFGTVSPTLVIKAAARENAAWVCGATPTEAADAAQNVRDVFYVRTPEWQESVMARGLVVVNRALAALATVPEAF